MKKTFLSIAILASSIVAFAATGNSAKSATPTPTEQTAPAKQDNVKKNGKKADRNASSAEGRRAHEDRLFEGINLTDNQKERLAALKEKIRSEREAAKKDGKERGDKLSPEQREQMKSQKDSARKSFLAGVKEILSPEQYVTFLENSFSTGGKGHKMHKGAHKKHDGSAKKHDRKQAPSARKGVKTDKSQS